MPQPNKLFTNYARKFWLRIEDLKRKAAPPVPVKSYAGIGATALAALLLTWLLPQLFIPRGSEAVSVSHRLTTTDSTQGHKTPPTGSLPENGMAGKPVAPPPKSGFEMVPVQGGAFIMGSPANEANRFENECQHPVSVRSFSIGKYEVTQADWRDIMGSDPPLLASKGCDQCPVENVSCNDVEDFLKKLNTRYPGKNYRLPTETEWEYAARGGSAGRDSCFFWSGGNDPNAVAWHYDNSGSETHPVGTKKPNQLGIFDMSGNVWELCQGLYQAYPCDNKFPKAGRDRVIRGGSAFHNKVDCRVAYRRSFEPAYPVWHLGFRLVSVSSQ